MPPKAWSLLCFLLRFLLPVNESRLRPEPSLPCGSSDVLSERLGDKARRSPEFDIADALWYGLNGPGLAAPDKQMSLSDLFHTANRSATNTYRDRSDAVHSTAVFG